jgi:hypothetical protein
VVAGGGGGPTEEKAALLESLLGVGHPAVVEFRAKIPAPVPAGGPAAPTVEGLAALQKVLGLEHPTCREYQQQLAACVEQARKDKEGVLSVQERVAGKVRYAKILVARRDKAAKRCERAAAALGKAQEEHDAAAGRLQQVQAAMQECDVEVKALMAEAAAGQAAEAAAGSDAESDAPMGSGMAVEASDASVRTLVWALLHRLQTDGSKEAGVLQPLAAVLQEACQAIAEGEAPPAVQGPQGAEGQTAAGGGQMPSGSCGILAVPSAGDGGSVAARRAAFEGPQRSGAGSGAALDGKKPGGGSPGAGRRADASRSPVRGGAAKSQ